MTVSPIGSNHLYQTQNAPVSTHSDEKGVTKNALSTSSSVVQAALLNLQPGGVSSR